MPNTKKRNSKKKKSPFWDGFWNIFEPLGAFLEIFSFLG
jgi:hypothetical protein